MQYLHLTPASMSVTGDCAFHRIFTEYLPKIWLGKFLHVDKNV